MGLWPESMHLKFWLQEYPENRATLGAVITTVAESLRENAQDNGEPQDSAKSWILAV